MVGERFGISRAICSGKEAAAGAEAGADAGAASYVAGVEGAASAAPADPS